jgi:archaellum biogenesis protein FlaJ (TadC family)
MSMMSKQQNKPAIIYQSLYLANLLLVPALSFLLLIYCLYKAKSLSHFNRIHLIRSIQISAIAGVTLGLGPTIYIFYSNQFSTSMMITAFYFVTLHAVFVLVGIFNLARAMSRKLPLF